MRRLFVTTSVVALLGLPAFAGGVAEPVMESNVVVQDTTSSASGIVVPLLLLLLIAAAVAGRGERRQLCRWRTNQKSG